MLGSEAEQDGAALADAGIDDRASSGDVCLAFEPAALKHVSVRVAGHDARRGACLAAVREFEARAEREERARLRRHAERQRVRGVERDAQDRSRAEELLGGPPPQGVADWQRERVDDELARRIDRDESSAGPHELPERHRAVLAEAADVLGRHGEGIVSVPQALGVHVGQDDRVVAGAQTAAPDVLVRQAAEGELVLLEQPAGPPFVDRRHPGLVEADTAAVKAPQVRRHPAAHPRGPQAEVVDEPRHEFAGAVRVLDHDGTGGVRVAQHVLRRRRPRRREPGCEQLVDGDRPGVAAPVDHVVVGPGLAPEIGSGDARLSQARARRRLKGLFDSIDGHTHLQGQRPAGHVVRPFRRPVRREPSDGVHLHLEQRLGVGTIRLRHQDQVGALGVDGLRHAERLGCTVDLDAAVEQQLTQPVGRVGVVLLGRDDEGKGLSLRAPDYGATAHRVEIADDLLAVPGRACQQSAHCGQVVVHDVAQAPGAAGPGVGEVDLRAVLGQAARRALQFDRRHTHRRRYIHARGLAEQAHHVVSERRRVLVSRPVVVEHRALKHALAAVLLHGERHGMTEQARRAPEEGVVIRVDGVVVRRHEIPGSSLTHLVHREEHLRVPLAVEEVRERPVLDHVHHEGVAVDVVARVLVIQPRHGAAFEVGSPPAVVPVHRQHMSVRVERRKQDQHHLAQHARRFLVVGRGQRVQELVGGLRGANLGCVDARADHDDDGLTGGDGTSLRLADRSGIREPAAGRLDLVKAREVLRRGDDGAAQPPPFRRRAGVDERDAVRDSRHGLEVALDLHPAGQLAVGSHGEAEVCLWSGHRDRGRLRRCEGRKEKEEREQEDREAH